MTDLIICLGKNIGSVSQSVSHMCLRATTRALVVVVVVPCWDQRQRGGPRPRGRLKQFNFKREKRREERDKTKEALSTHLAKLRL